MNSSRAVQVSDQIPGWLMKVTADFSEELIRKVLSNDSPICEIGVYRGKYLSVAALVAGGRNRIVGYDIFPHNQQELIIRDMERIFGTARNIILRTKNSLELTAKEIITDCGGRPDFFSIDGSHDAQYVFSDIVLAENSIGDNGVVALDDFLNVYAVGVNEAYHRYMLSSGSRLAPFAFVANKLFLCREGLFAAYRDLAEKIVMQKKENELYKNFFKRKEKGMHTSVQLSGKNVLVVTA